MINESNWWDPFELPRETQRTLALPGFRMTLRHMPSEWQVEYRQFRAEDDENPGYSLSEIEPAEHVIDQIPIHGTYSPLPNTKLVRKVIGIQQNQVRFQPRTGDKPFVIRPHVPVSLEKTTQTTIFVSTPVWIQAVEADTGKAIIDLPVNQPSDTWIGKDRMEGELCYATETTGRLTMESIRFTPDRIFTPVEIHNKGNDELYLERFSIPIQYCKIYFDSKGFLWTQSIRLVRETTLNEAHVKILPGPPRMIEPTQYIGDARQTENTNRISRAVSLLFG